MSDGLGTGGGCCGWEGDDHYTSASHSVKPPITRLHWLGSDLHELVGWLPRLGNVLWIYRVTRSRLPGNACTSAQGVLLFEHPSLVLLAQCTEVAMQSAVTPHGPREWLTFLDMHGDALAKLYLLPDTDYFIWDEMLSCRNIPRVPSVGNGDWQAPCKSVREYLGVFAGERRARVMRFASLRLPWLLALGVRAPNPVSPLSLQFALAVARSDHAELSRIHPTR